MIVIRCPCCGEQRTEEELVHGGEAVVRPVSPQAASDVEWTDYLFMRENLPGPQREQWFCRAGCGQWFKVIRDTVTDEVAATARLDDPFSD